MNAVLQRTTTVRGVCGTAVAGDRKKRLWSSSLPHLSVAFFLFPLRPPSASTLSGEYDLLFYFLTAVSVFFTVLIFAMIFYFMIKYRRKSEDEIPPFVPTSTALEVTWSVIPMGLCVIMFFWASSLYFRNAVPPRNAIEIFAVGKQWMWHLQHPDGTREINALHIPVGVPVKVTLTSEDVIHDFYIPAFRIKHDVLPGRYFDVWFQATTPGVCHLYCAQYCGTFHSSMIGWVYVMTPEDYANWQASATPAESMAEVGQRLFSQYGCDSCHLPDNSGRGPSLVGVYGHPQKLVDGRTVPADDALLRSSIVNPNSTLLPGYAPVMPSYQGQIDEEQLLQLIAYIKSLGPQERTSQGQ